MQCVLKVIGMGIMLLIGMMRVGDASAASLIEFESRCKTAGGTFSSTDSESIQAGGTEESTSGVTTYYCNASNKVVKDAERFEKFKAFCSQYEGSMKGSLCVVKEEHNSGSSGSGSSESGSSGESSSSSSGESSGGGSVASSVEEAINKLPNSNGVSPAFLGNVLNWIYALAGLIAVGVIIFGAIKYNTAQGDPGKVKQAGQIIAFAVVGLVIVLLAGVITAFATGTIGGAA